MPLPTTSTVSRPRAFGFGARLDDLYLRLAVGPDRVLDIQTAPLQAQRLNTAANPEDFRNEFGQLFSRSDFTAGEGLAFAHRRDGDDSDVARYWDSSGIDVSPAEPGAPPRLRLLYATELSDPSANANLHLAWDGTALYMSSGTTVRRSTNPSDDLPVFADDDPHAGEGAVTVNDLCAVGSSVYAALGAQGIHKRSGGAWAHLSATAAVNVWSAKGYLLASTGTVLSKVDQATGVSTTIVTLPAGLTWLDVVDAGAAILAAASDGYIYAITVDGTGAFTLRAQSLVDAPQIPYALGVGPGGAFVMFGTCENTPSGGCIGRLWRASLDSSAYVLTDAALIRQWGDQTSEVDASMRRIFTAGSSVFVGVQDAEDASHLWRYDAVTAGRSRHLSAGGGGMIVDGLALDGRLFFTVEEAGLRRENVGTYESNGWLMSPLADFFTADAKSWAGALLDHTLPPADSRVELFYTTDAEALGDPDSDSWVRAKNVSGRVDSTETVLIDVSGRFLAGMVRLYSATSLVETPEVRSFSYRAYPGPGDVIVTLPVNVSDQIDIPHRRRIVARGHGRRVYDELKGREGTYAELELVHVGEVLQGLVEQVSTPMQQLSERGSALMVSIVRFRGRRSSDSSLSDSLFGVGSLGVMFLGGKEIDD